MAKELDEKTQALVDKAAAKARKEAFKDAIAAAKDAGPDTEGLDRAVAKPLKDLHKQVVTAIKEAAAD